MPSVFLLISIISSFFTFSIILQSKNYNCTNIEDEFPNQDQIFKIYIYMYSKKFNEINCVVFLNKYYLKKYIGSTFILRRAFLYFK